MRVVCISDTHNRLHKLAVPPGDLLIHAGDLTGQGSLDEIAREHRAIAALPHRYKVIIAGNHDFGFERAPAEARALITSAIYLQDESVTIEGLRIYGSPWQPWFWDWAFNWPRGKSMKPIWDKIPEGTDILVTHGPPLGHGDRCVDGNLAGCPDLLDAIRRVKPRYHIFGHIHEGYGRTQEGPTTCVNASTCDFHYKPIQPAIVFDWPTR
jgi:Icc-related predicted phosphoesterase